MIRPLDSRVLLGRDTATMASVVITAVEAGLVSAAAAELLDRHVRELRGLPGIAAPMYAGRDGGWFVLVAPLAHGVPLAERLPPDGLSLPAALQVARDLIGALSAVHGRDLVHLSISTSTVLVNPDGAVRSATLVGFGAAVLRDCASGERGPGDVRYAAPELAGALDRPVDRRADLYSLGLVLHECLRGRPPFAAATDGELLRRRLTDQPPPLRVERPEIPPEVEAAILAMLAVEPAARPPDAAEILRAFATPAAGASSAPAAPARSSRGRSGRGRPAALIGRATELAELVEHLQAAAAGRGSAVLLQGPSGIGKTRLLDELCRQAREEGATVLRGRACEYPPSPASALDGVVDGLIELTGSGSGPDGGGDRAGRLRAAAAGDAGPELCALLPRLRPLLGLAGALAAWRLELLPEDVRKLLAAGALIGREFSLDLAAAMLGRGDTWTELARDDAERRLLVAPAGADGRRLTFCHDELRAALLAGIPPPERRRLHGRARDVLTREGAVYAAAWHALASGDPLRAVPRALAAAHAATERQAPDVAELYLREARRHAPDLAPDMSLELVEDLAAVHLAQGRPDLAEEQLAAASRLVQEPAHQAAISASLARLGASRGDRAAATTAAEAAIRSRGGHLPGSSAIVLGALLLVELLACLRPRAARRRSTGDHPPGEAAAEYALLARCYAAAGRRAAGAWAALRALRLAEAAGPGPLLVECRSVRARLLHDAGRHSRAATAAAGAASAAAATGDGQLIARAAVLEGEILYAAGRPDVAVERFAGAADLLDPEDETAAQAAVLRAGYCDYRLGRTDEARETASAVRRHALAAGSPELAAEALGLWLKAGGPPGPPLPPGGPSAPSAALLEARGLEWLAAGQLDQAIDALEQAAAAPGEREGSASARAWLAEALRRAAESAPGPTATRRAGAAAQAAVGAARVSRTNLPHALREQGRVDALAGRARRAERRLRRSLREAERQSAGDEAARSIAALRPVGLAPGPDAATRSLGARSSADEAHPPAPPP
ncbi:MAG: AAA family ATPase, partial [Actinobacteria bacterium]|nr:AAA family ATPase [Actinomycetota bacterium]